ncbi:MAG: serine O-acetyltransferase EpsC [Tissierellia bacterium]|nr:serine O-acetyltransferase EpsC [Tissierellia bacterium]
MQAIQPISCHYRDYKGLKEQVLDLIEAIRTYLYPEIYGSCNALCELDYRKEKTYYTCRALLHRVIQREEDIEKISQALLEALPEIKRQLDTDIDAAFAGDPAAQSREEIILAYPSFEAVSIYRPAHALYKLHVPILPRMMTEYAHRTTGIDIHPGATIGDHFFIDHGTGVVIGETATLGHHVKIYQGVTIGAKSFQEAEDGSLVKGMKRHPDIGNHVVIYAGTTILGGETQIGDHCVIGGNVWLTHSIKAGETVVAAHEKIEQIKIK